MEPGQEFNLVEKSAFLNLLKQYPDHISSSSEKLRHLDEQRCVMIPNLVNERCNDPYLTQAEVVTLVEWKL